MSTQELPRSTQELLRSTQELPRNSQELPRNSQESPKEHPRAPKQLPRAPKERPRCFYCFLIVCLPLVPLSCFFVSLSLSLSLYIYIYIYIVCSPNNTQRQLMGAGRQRYAPTALCSDSVMPCLALEGVCPK